MMAIHFDFRRLFSPWHWYQQGPTDWGWDEALSLALDRFDVRREGVCKHSVGPFVVWTENFPYAFGGRCFSDDSGFCVKQEGLPSLSTRFRLLRVIQGIALSEAKLALAAEGERG